MVSSKIKVCLVSSYPPNRGRLSEYAKDLSNALAEKSSIEKIYVLADIASGPTVEPENEKIEVLRLWEPNNILSLLSILIYLRKIDPDIVHFNSHFQSFGTNRIVNFFGLMLPFLCRLQRKKSVITIHNLGEKVDLTKCQISPSIINIMGVKLATKFITMGSYVTVTVESYVSFLKEQYNCRNVKYIPHGASANENKIQNNSEEKVILMFGHMEPHKGFSVLKKAFQKLLKEDPEMKLIIAGDSHPNCPKYLEKIKKETDLPNVEFKGYIKKEDLPTIFGNASIVVLPYLTTTGTSGVFHLACSYGKPIIASDFPEIRELLEKGASAILVPPEDPRKLKTSIQHALSDPEKLSKMGKQNLSFAKDQSWEKITDEFIKLYSEILNEN